MTKYVPLTNKQVIRIWKDKDKIQKRLRENTKKYKRLAKSIERDESKLQVIDSGGKLEMHHGQLLSINIWKSKTEWSNNHGANINAIAEDNKRAARIYLNQHNYKTYGAHIYDYNLEIYDRKREKWLGANWEEFEVLLDACIKYVALGEVPK